MNHSFSLFLLLLLALPLHAENWMKRLPDNAYVSTLSIPGSHDTGTGNGFPGATTSIYGPFGDKYARTQDKNLEEQWNIGVRAFDFRPAVKNSYINVNHGIMPTNLRFDDALTFLRDKLTENPSEFVVIHLLHASDGDDSGVDYGGRLLELLGRSDLKDFFIDFKKDLTVKEMRGKILLLSRNEYAPSPVGGFFRNWTGQVNWSAQTNGKIVGANGSTANLYMQDYAETHEDGALDVKVNAIRQLLDFSTKHKTNTATDIVWVYNFASAYSKTSRLYIPFFIDQEISSSDGYRDNAAHTNAAIIDYLSNTSNTPGPTGIILADYVGVNTSNGFETRGQELVDAIIANNFRYLKDMYQVGESDATYRKPLDMSARIVNNSFNSNMLPGWEGDAFGAVSPKENAEHYNRNFDTYQTITDLPNGVYAIGCKAFYRAGEPQEAYDHFRIKDLALRYARLYATTDDVTLTFPFVSPFSKTVTKAKGVGREAFATNGTRSYYIPDDMVSAEYYMHALNAYDNLVFAGVDNHTLTFGVRKDVTIGSDWCCFDDFTLTYYGNEAAAYRQWLTEMKKKKLSYTSAIVSTDYLNAYNTAFSATASDKESAVAAMQAIDACWEEIAANAALWAEYVQVGEEAEAILNSIMYSEEAKSFLRNYYQNVFLARLSALELTNDELPEATQELRDYMELVSTGEWTGISSVPSDNGQWSTDNGQWSMVNGQWSTVNGGWTLDGKSVLRPKQPGLYIMPGSDGKHRKVLR